MKHLLIMAAFIMTTTAFAQTPTSQQQPADHTKDVVIGADHAQGVNPQNQNVDQEEEANSIERSNNEMEAEPSGNPSDVNNGSSAPAAPSTTPINS